MGFFSRKHPDVRTLPPGLRVYAIGDIHGRLDLLDQLLDRICRDSAARPRADTLVVLLGDLIDRGPDSAGVVARAMRPLGWARTVTLKGNHEAALLGALDGDGRILSIWLRNGGREAMASWGLDPAIVDAPDATSESIAAALSAVIPTEHRAFLARCPLSLRLGDYFFVHAGVKPGIALDAQREEDTLWIREAFLDSKRDHGALIVHGHSIKADVEDLPNRIGLDTGAYKSGKLTALGLQGTGKWFLQTGADTPA